jgi:hypothetical protein
MEKDRYREGVRKNMEKIEEKRKEEINGKRMEVEFKVEMTFKNKEEELKIKKEIEYLKRLDRKENVERI